MMSVTRRIRGVRMSCRGGCVVEERAGAGAGKGLVGGGNTGAVTGLGGMGGR